MPEPYDDPILQQILAQLAGQGEPPMMPGHVPVNPLRRQITPMPSHPTTPQQNQGPNQPPQTTDPLVSILQKAQTIGPPHEATIGPSRLGERYNEPLNLATGGDSVADVVRRVIGGDDQPPSVQQQSTMGVGLMPGGGLGKIGALAEDAAMTKAADPLLRGPLSALAEGEAAAAPSVILATPEEQSILKQAARVKRPFSHLGSDSLLNETLGRSMADRPGLPEGSVIEPGAFDDMAGMGPSRKPRMSRKKTVAPALYIPQPPDALGSLAEGVLPGPQGAPYELKPEVIDRIKWFLEHGDKMSNNANWEGPSQELIHSFGGNKDMAMAWSRLWGATSPKTGVPNNTRESVAALLYMLEHGPNPVMTEEIAQNLTPNPITMAPSKVPNINRVYQDLPLGSPKANAMAEFMVGNERIPIDVHALFGLGANSKVFQSQGKGLRALMAAREGVPLRGSFDINDIYGTYEKLIADALASIDPSRTQNPKFATFWEGVRKFKGLKYQGGPLDILREKGLLQYGAMLDPDKLRAALAQAGWKPGAIAGLLATMAAGQEQSDQSGEAGAADGATPQPQGEQ
jgi:hypothetical protein